MCLPLAEPIAGIDHTTQSVVAKPPASFHRNHTFPAPLVSTSSSKRARHLFVFFFIFIFFFSIATRLLWVHARRCEPVTPERFAARQEGCS